MNYQEFQTCVRAFFPGIKIFHEHAAIVLKPHAVERFSSRNSGYISEMLTDYNLPYGYYKALSMNHAHDLVIGFRCLVDDDGNHVGGGDPYYVYGYDKSLFYTDETFINLLKIANRSGIFHYDREPEGDR